LQLLNYELFALPLGKAVLHVGEHVLVVLGTEARAVVFLLNLGEERPIVGPLGRGRDALVVLALLDFVGSFFSVDREEVNKLVYS
jgi:hypothetical protein